MFKILLIQKLNIAKFSKGVVEKKLEFKVSLNSTVDILPDVKINLLYRL